MEQQSAPSHKKILLWIQVGLGALLLVLIVLIAVLAAGSASSGETTGTTEPSTAAATEETTVQTEPPLPTSPFGYNDFQYDGDYLTCLTQESVLGIDVSIFQGIIDWQAVKDAGVDFAIIRVGGRGYGTEGKLYADDNAQINYEGAKAAGIQVGAYFFSQAITEAEAREEAAYILEQTAHWEMDMPIVYDWEYISEEARTANLDPRTLTECTRAFCETVEQAGREAMIYFNPEQSHKQFYIEELGDYRFWLAMYADRMLYPHRVDMWQYTNEGTVPGIEGNVDINLYFPNA